MKKQNYFWTLLTVIMSVGLMMAISSCGGDDDPEPTPTPTPTQVTIKVNGSLSTSLSFEGSFDGKSGLDLKQAVSVYSDVDWTMSTDVDWLSISPRNGGKGVVEMTIYPKTENPSPNPREATITLVGDGASATIKVEQSGGASGCMVSIANEVALYNSLCWECTATEDVNMFQYIILSEETFNLMTENELTDMVKSTERNKFALNYIFFPNKDSFGEDIVPNTTYYIITLATDSNDKYGALNKQRITTPAYKNSDDDAWVSLNGSFISSGFQFDAKKEGRCDKYHVVYGCSKSLKNPVVYAFVINYYLKYNKKHWITQKDRNEDWVIETYYPNEHTFTYVNSYLSEFQYVFACAQGIFSDGTLSSDAMLIYGEISSSSSSSPIQRAAAAAYIPENTQTYETEFPESEK